MDWKDSYFSTKQQCLKFSVMEFKVSALQDRVLGNISVEEMEHKRHIFLHQVRTNYYFHMLFLFIFIYNQHLHIISNELAEITFNQDNKMTWQDWKSFNVLFEVFLNNFLLYKKEKIDLTLGDFYHKSDGHDDTENLHIELNPLEVVPVVIQVAEKQSAQKYFGRTF